MGLRYLVMTTAAAAALLLAWQPCPASGETDFGDPLVTGRRVLRASESPYLVTSDVLVTPEGELDVEPGVEVRFRPEVGVTVRGVMRAVGTPARKIRFVPAELVAQLQPNRTIRLVDGPSVNEGIVQVSLATSIIYSAIRACRNAETLATLAKSFLVF